MANLDDLRKQWTTLYARTLPQLANARSPVQTGWAVTLDHCFARIILDYTIGHGERQWDHVVDKPAVRNMTEQQLQDAIALAEQVASGKADLCYLNEISLQCRGKHETDYVDRLQGESAAEEQPTIPIAANRKRTLEEDSDYPQPLSGKQPKTEKGQSMLCFSPSVQTEYDRPLSPDLPKESGELSDELKRTVQRIRSHPSMTPYRKKLYLTLLSVPRGRYTTYASMSDYLKSSARAVGNGMRNNPFAPEVPCHRVLAANGTIGGFNGDWGKDGKYASKKVELLRSEGVKFDGVGKVVGVPFRQFHSFEHVD
ncbi:hypothetical protein ABEF93_006666 [Exophiala dermatitidis]